LSSEEDIKTMCKQLEEIDECAKCLGNDDSVRVLQHKPKLAQLKSVQQKQVNQVTELSEDLKHLLLGYNQFVTNLSEKFAIWDECLCLMEEKKQMNEGR